MYLHATGTVPDIDKLAPYWDEETRTLAVLHAEGVVKNVFRIKDRPGVYLIVEANDVEDARKRCSEAERGARIGHNDGTRRFRWPGRATLRRGWWRLARNC
jgi:hypothetical protein